MPESTPQLALPPAYAPLNLTGNLRQTPADFQVTEVLGFNLSGEGEHHLVNIEKTGQNTQWVAGQLAKFAGIKSHAVGFCGRKDRHAVTTQWFSLHMPGQQAPDWAALDIPGCNIKEIAVHNKKLRPGMHKANIFKIRLTGLKSSPSSTNDAPTVAVASKTEEDLIERLETIASAGVPNYFGYQRFGRNGQNLLQARKWLVENKAPRRDQRSIILSSARAFIFNQVLAARVTQKTWQTIIAGDVILADQPTGPLWGRGRSNTQEDALDIEQTALSPYADWLESLEHKGLSQERRSLVLKPAHFEFAIEHLCTPNASLTLSFELGTGAFATTVLTEILDAKDCSLQA